MENNLYLNFEDQTQQIAGEKGLEKGLEKGRGKKFFTIKFLEKRSRLETTDAAIEPIDKKVNYS